MKKIILGTDWGTDVDDVIAAKVLISAVKSKQIELLGVVANTCMPYTVQSIDGFFMHYGIDIPVGIDFSADNFETEFRYQKYLVSQTKSKYKSNNDAECGVKLYRKLLACAQEKVDIIEIGFQQILSDLLHSPPDEISPLFGLELIQEKVSKLWVMGGDWSTMHGGKEHNFCLNKKTIISVYDVCENWPTEVCFLGFETGVSVITGSKLQNDYLLKGALKAFGTPKGRSSWDPMLTYMAILGNEKIAGYQEAIGWASIDISSGENFWKLDGNGRHKYVKKLYKDNYYEQQIDDIIDCW